MDPIKLQKYFTDCGILSRRAAEEEIRQGRVRVNGHVAELGMRVTPGVDVVEYGGKSIRPRAEPRICIMLNKPRGYVTTLSDEKGRPTVAQLTQSLGQRVYPVGRLDMDSDGLLLLTNDGALANRLTHPKHEIPKIYHVTVQGKPSADIMRTLNRSMELDGYMILPVKTVLLCHNAERNESVLEMTLFEGRNRQIRKMCALVNLHVLRLCRVALGELSLGELPLGHWRLLSEEELAYLRGTAPSVHS
ncbi:MAG: rRNA pseudouridine synthase [Clostridia bacterium]|nr:rRNA pseudouridine synthase [Clostridia bacterium]